MSREVAGSAGCWPPSARGAPHWSSPSPTWASPSRWTCWPDGGPALRDHGARVTARAAVVAIPSTSRPDRALASPWSRISYLPFWSLHCCLVSSFPPGLVFVAGQAPGQTQDGPPAWPGSSAASSRPARQPTPTQVRMRSKGRPARSLTARTDPAVASLAAYFPVTTVRAWLGLLSGGGGKRSRARQVGRRPGRVDHRQRARHEPGSAGWPLPSRPFGGGGHREYPHPA